MATKPVNLSISLIVPVYNRPQEILELLHSLSEQTDKAFEIVIVEDGSTQTCEHEISQFSDKLDIKYFTKENTGPGITRNYGYDRSSGNYGIFLDSDCIIPPQYIATVKESLNKNYVDAFGGPDKADSSFTILQKAIDYSMTSFFTTGGIRGGGENLDKFYPRSFNMGISREVYEKTGGFPSARFADSKAAGEDIELSIQIYKLGFKIGLIKEAYVYHKRRTSLRQFFKQVFNFGYARITLSKRNKGSLKWVHLLPSVFTIGTILLLILSLVFSWKCLFPIILFAGIIFLDASIRKRNLLVGFTSIITSFIQLLGYGFGFLKAWIDTFSK